MKFMQALLPGILLSIFAVSCSVQSPLILQEGEVRNELHRSSIGEIAFMSDWIPFDQFSKDQFQKEVTLGGSRNFGFRMFLDKTLTYSLHQLEPDLPVRELCQKGNFQLTFNVDGEQIFQYNLQPGAGSCEYKNSATVYGVPFIHKDNPDHWGRFLWTRFMKKEGGQEALSKGTHQLEIVVRPYIQNEEIKVGKIIARGSVTLSYKLDNVDEELIAIQKIAPTSEWVINNSALDTQLIRTLNEKIAQNYFKEITSIVVIKNGELILEEYFNGANRQTLHDTRSVGKSLTSTLLGIAIRDGHIADESMTLDQFYNIESYKNYSPAKKKVTLKSLLTMTSGLEGSDMNPDSPGNEEKMYVTSDWVEFALNLPMDKSKENEKDWEYFTAGVVVLGDILNSVVPNGLESYAHHKLFEPLGIKNYNWQYTPTGVPNTAGGFQMSSLDNAKYGQLYLNNGAFQDSPILTKEWTENSLYKHVQIPDVTDQHYGYLFWNQTFVTNHKTYDSFLASGNGGNKIVIFKDLNSVVVITSQAYNQPYMHQQAHEMITEYILPAIVD